MDFSPKDLTPFKLPQDPSGPIQPVLPGPLGYLFHHGEISVKVPKGGGTGSGDFDRERRGECYVDDHPDSVTIS